MDCLVKDATGTHNSNLFSMALGLLDKNRAKKEDVDEDDATKQHGRFYGDDLILPRNQHCSGASMVSLDCLSRVGKGTTVVRPPQHNRVNDAAVGTSSPQVKTEIPKAAPGAAFAKMGQAKVRSIAGHRPTVPIINSV
jgi:hypothetical protein